MKGKKMLHSNQKLTKYVLFTNNPIKIDHVVLAATPGIMFGECWKYVCESVPNEDAVF